MKGLIHIYEGDGKGKTTASIGLSIRCAGNGEKVIFTQFLKDNQSNELKVLEGIDNIQVVLAKKVFGFTFLMTPEQKIEAKQYFRSHFKEVTDMAIKEGVRLLVLDEIISSYNMEFVDQQEVLNFLKNKPEELEVVLTGRDPAPELVERADYVTRMMKIKHPFDQKMPARKGIEF